MGIARLLAYLPAGALTELGRLPILPCDALGEPARKVRVGTRQEPGAG